MMEFVFCQLRTDDRLLGRRGGWVGGAEDEHVGGVGAERDAVFFKGEDDTAAEFAEDRVPLIGTDTELDRISDGAAFDLVDPEDDGIGDSDVFVGRSVAHMICY